MVSESVRSVTQGQYERHVTHHGRGILDAILGIGMLGIGAAFGVAMGDSFELGDLAQFFGPILWVALFAVPLVALSLARPFTALRDCAQSRPGTPWFNLAYIGRLALIVLFIAVAAVPVLVRFREETFGRFGLDTAIPDILINERVGVTTLLMGWVLIAWMTVRVAHHLAIAGSPEQTNQNDRVVLFTKAPLTIFRWIKRRAREHKNRPRDPVITDARKGRRPQGDPRPATVRPYSGSFTDDDFTTRELPPLGGVGHGHSPRAHEPSVVAYGGSGHRSESSGHGDSAHYPDSPVYSGSLLDSLGEPTSATTD